MIDKDYIAEKSEEISDLKKKASQLLSKAENEEQKLRDLVKDDVFKYLEICDQDKSFIENVESGFKFAKFDGYSIIYQIFMPYGFELSLDTVNNVLQQGDPHEKKSNDQ